MITSPLNRANFMDLNSFDIKELFYISENKKYIYLAIKYNCFSRISEVYLWSEIITKN